MARAVTPPSPSLFRILRGSAATPPRRQGMEEQAALEAGMQEKSEEFRKTGLEIYV